MELKISVIMPVYNVEKYLSDCIDSVINQTYKNLEIILVNDGSTDTSPDICNSYSTLDNRVKVINKINGGISSARNEGIKIATGDYIVCLDSDDYWIDENVAQKIADKIIKEKSEVILFGFKYYFESTKEFKNYFDYKNKENLNNIFDIVKNNYFVSSAWTKVVRRDVILDNNLFFKEGVYSEDIEWSAKLILTGANFSLITEDLYAYRIREGSVTANITSKNIFDLKNNILSSLENVQNIENNIIKECFYNYIAYQYITLLNLLNFVDFDTKADKRQMKEYKYLLKYNYNPKVRMIYKVDKIFGYNIMMNILNLYIKIRGNRI